MKIIAHRGASYDAPENTLASVRLAWEQGADAVEVDVQLTRDQEIVVMHDANTQRTTGVEALVAELTLEEIQQLDAGSWKEARFQGEHVPTLAEVLALRPAGKQCVVEIKGGGPAMVEKLAALVRATNLTPECVLFICFDLKLLMQMRILLPEYETLLLLPPPEQCESLHIPPLKAVIEGCLQAGILGLNLNYGWLDGPSVVQQIREAGLKLYVWTVNEPELALAMAQIGVDGVTTDRPGFIGAFTL